MSSTRTSTRPSADASFASVGVPSLLIEALRDQGITSPFPIQTVTLPDSLTGRDVLGRGRTGSGKTIAFALPLITRLSADRQRARANRPRGLVLLPTRELAAQVEATIEPLARTAGLSTTTIYGGVSQRPQVTALSQGVDIVVACPGRLEDLITQGHVRLDDVAVTVIDEADHMADLGFLPAVKRILDRTPKGGQRLLFSATLDRGVDALVKRYLSNPITHSVDSDATTEPDMEHHVLTVRATDKPQIVHELAAGEGRSVLFVRTKHQAKKLARTLTQAGIPAVDLQGNLAQKAREKNMEAFRCGEVKVLVATDIAARGIHVDDVALVVHVDPPTEHKAYLHRSGRTARAGAFGVVVTLQTSDQASDVAAMTRKAGISVTAQRTVPGAPQLLELTGPRAAHVAPTVETVPSARTRTPKATGGSSHHGRRRRASSGKRTRTAAEFSASRPRR
ncbi:MAG: DEAD/DEAH box helicase [Candidatus Nanopelagicales bacterium]